MQGLRTEALAVLRNNDAGDSTKPAPRLYPHQWSWDSAFISIGLAHVDLDRALRELESLFAAQWSDGRVPHIVFNPTVMDYFPGAHLWASAHTSRAAPRDRATSGLIQPPVHALALQRILDLADTERAPDLMARLRRLYPRLLAWHRYLAEQRDPSGEGMLVIYHPWESGTDNSPRWDAALARIAPGPLPAFQRHDLKVVDDPGQRPTQLEYERYLWLVELLKERSYEDALIQRDYPFQIQDVLMSAIFAAACAALGDVARRLEQPDGPELDAYVARFTGGVLRAWDDRLSLALDYDTRSERAVEVQTCAGLAPLLLPHAPRPVLDKVVEELEGPRFMGAAGLAFPVIPSTVSGSPGFQARAYWRGPVWPVFNWLIWWALGRQGLDAVAERLRSANLALLEAPGAEFAEYFEPYTSEPLGSLQQSWTAAVALDWLAASPA